VATKAGAGEIEMRELGEALEPRGWELRSVEVVPGEIEVPNGGEAKDSRIKSRALQVAPTQVKGSHKAVGVVAAHALPAAAVRAGPP
jgi:hypothetical protein